MTYLEALLLGAVQGLTEFLPVSSSGHLVLAHHWFGVSGEVDWLYDVLLHVATAGAVLVYFREDLWGLCRGLLGKKGRGTFEGWEFKATVYMALALFPTAAIGLMIERYFLESLLNPKTVGLMLVVTGTVLWLARGVTRKTDRFHAHQALSVGLVQGLAVLPGISRSGSTIAAGVLLGVERNLAARFSLLISVPAILGAALLEILKAAGRTLPPLGPYLAGMLAAAVIGYLAIGLILRLVSEDRFHWFAYYLWPVGAAAFFFGS